VLLTVNSVREAIDDGVVSFTRLKLHQEIFRQVPRYDEPSVRSQSEVVQFLAGKAYLLGLMTADHPSEIWAVDPWDAKYLGVSTKDLALAMRALQATIALIWNEPELSAFNRQAAGRKVI
jgi:hypothetical protein